MSRLHFEVHDTKLVVQEPGSHSLVAGDATLLVFGHDLIRALGLTSATLEARFVLPLREHGGAFVSTLPGGFVFALHTPGVSIIGSDPSGRFAFYYRQTSSGALHASTQLLPLIRAGFAAENEPVASLAEPLVLEQLALSQNLDGRSMFPDIKRLGRGSLLRYQANALTLSEYITRESVRSCDPQLELGSIYDALNEAVLRDSEAWLGAGGHCLEEQSGKRVTVALSGGYDSRLTWGLLLGATSSERNRIGANGQTLRSAARDPRNAIAASTHGLSGCRDIEIAGKIARSLGLRHDVLALDQHDLAQLSHDWLDFVRRTDGLYSLGQIHSYAAARELGQRYDVLVDSYGGELYKRRIKFRAETSIDPHRELAPQVLPYDIAPLMKTGLLRQSTREEASTIALGALRDYYARIEHVESLGDKFDLFYRDQTMALRDSASANLQMQFIEVRHPLMDDTALEAARRLPSVLRRRYGIHRYILRKAYPNLERFWLDSGGYPAPYRNFWALRLVAPSVELAVNRLRPTRHSSGSGSRLLRRPPMDAMQVLSAGLGLATELLLSPHPNYDGLIDLSEVERVLWSVRAGDAREAEAMLQLLTYRAMLEVI